MTFFTSQPRPHNGKLPPMPVNPDKPFPATMEAYAAAMLADAKRMGKDKRLKHQLGTSGTARSGPSQGVVNARLEQAEKARAAFLCCVRDNPGSTQERLCGILDISAGAFCARLGHLRVAGHNIVANRKTIGGKYVHFYTLVE